MSKPFEAGLRQAERVIQKDPDAVEYWLGRARASRRRWRTWLLDRNEHRFLSGFIAGLENPPRDEDADAARPAPRAGTP